MTATRTGAVYDRGYRPYDGPRGGRRAAALALYRASVRRAVGLRRSWRQKFLPFSLLAVVSVPAAVNVGIKFATRNSPLSDFEFFTYRDYVGVSSALLLFVAVCAPDVICPERRQRVLPVIFARPLTGTDYVAAKLAAIASLVFAFSFLPQVLLFVGQALVSDGALAYVRDNAEIMWQVPVAIAVLALYYAALALAVSALSSRRVVAGATILGLTLVSSTVSAILTEAAEVNEAELLNLLSLPLQVRDLVFLGHLDPASDLSGMAGGGAMVMAAYVAVVAACLAVLFFRYRTVET
ncbi:MAG: ABC transporter permease [Acidimicrobiia bacterium]